MQAVCVSVCLGERLAREAQGTWRVLLDEASVFAWSLGVLSCGAGNLGHTPFSAGALPRGLLLFAMVLQGH